MKRELNSVGQWYLRRDTQEMFQVIDSDDRSGTIRIQSFDGTLDEIEEDAWRALSAQAVEPPEDWTGPLDSVDIDDLAEFFAEAGAQASEPFIEEREPWEDLMNEEALDAEAEQGEPDGEPDARHWRKEPFERGDRRSRVPSQTRV